MSNVFYYPVTCAFDVFYVGWGCHLTASIELEAELITEIVVQNRLFLIDIGKAKATPDHGPVSDRLSRVVGLS